MAKAPPMSNKVKYDITMATTYDTRWVYDKKHQ